MPIRIDLLAEGREAERTRLSDPVRQTMPVAGLLLSLVLLHMLELQCNIWFERKGLDRIDKRLRAIKSNFTSVNNNAVKDSEEERKLAALDKLSTNRFLWAPVLYTLRQSLTEDVRVTRLKGEQVRLREEPRHIGHGTKRKTIPGATIEKITLHIDAKDESPDHRNCLKFKQTLGDSEFFVERLGRKDGFVLDEFLKPATEGLAATNKAFVSFALAAHFPEVRR
jgi:hypothetical protein